MAPLTKEQSQSFQRILSIKPIATLIGIVCLSIALLIVTPSPTALAASNLTQLKASGGGCSVSFRKTDTVCLEAINGKAVSTASVVNPNGCPKSIEVKLFDNNGLVDSTTNSGCGSFKGPIATLTAGDTYTAQFIVDGSTIASPQLTAN